MPRHRLRRPETRLFKLWVEREVQCDRAQFDGFHLCHGIIATRNRFFAWLDSAACKNALAAVEGKQEECPTSTAMPSAVPAVAPPAVTAAVPTRVENTVVVIQPASRPRSKWIIFPVAIPGSGKTSIAVALSHLFGFVHTQSDDVDSKRTASIAPTFLTNVVKLLDENDVVIADKNNHLFQHRSSLRQAVANGRPPVKLLALHWATVTTNLPRNTVHRICADRIAARGENHQNLIPGVHGTHEGVLWRSLNDTHGLEADEFDACVEMEVDESLEEALARTVVGVVRVLRLPKPSQERVDEALCKARAYRAASRATNAPRGPAGSLSLI
ncbi:hypothetical protein AURDEDRAFT_171847 [Auricularia subglabra TFB-10046 SS5]|uniref:tRNA ligase kinase domain-containing protein n=1 Tax=Auricularia subglabra (strain TFB-10046 / SS5) TaxID=717982 RepID=J0LIK0_AURST|nr:hypothetical protein AURDEDRAFT_171847 [Auricularia subglabra TFB-10046 SS5]